MSLVPPPPTVNFRHPPPPTTTATATTAASSSSSSSHCLIPINNSNSRSIQRRVPKEAIGNKRLVSDLPFSSLILRPQTLDASSSSTGSPSLTTSVGPPPSVPPLRWNLGRRHILLLNATACAAAISASWLFFSAIPTLLSFKRAAESLEKLLDVTAEELPDTMAAIRLSGMEISDLTMELSDLGQEITQGVRSSTRAVRVAEDRLRRLTTMSPIVPAQGRTIRKDEKEGPILAKAVRDLREGIMKGRMVFGVIFSITQVSRWAFNFLTSRGEKRLSKSKQ